MRLKSSKKSLIFFSIAILLAARASAQTPCQLPPPTAAMDQEFAASLLSSVKDFKVRIALFPFHDGTQIDSDTTLEKGFPIVLYDFLSQVSGIGVYHPYILFNLTSARSLSLEKAFEAAPEAIAAAKEIGATHAVFGMFQKMPDNLLRYFIRIVDVEKGKPLAPPIDFVSEQGTHFFTIAAETAGVISKHAAKRNLTAASFTKQLSQAPGFEAFRFYLKGELSGASYHETDLAIAKVWFEKASSLAYNFERPRMEKVRVLFMAALLLKQMGKDYSVQLSEAINTLGPSSVRTPVKKSQITSLIPPERWLNAHQDYLAGVSFLQSGLTRDAEILLSRAVASVPEDGMAHHHLSQVLSRRGNARASQEAALASKLNPCLR